ncbi:Ldh family oxidoreductase [Jannaschia sp. Os4]|uniref:Ldh family oxidoreductase n=1 Tax=Jannaschia sp. Os4 TaxID=2807617 RepID=UPI001939369A|nr:Ldh family oxidoreductase [Jannaschia sp. Os4]MBM2575457.1 Ldh family oxidoreductase [Jannaschia sp. Os4]
MPTMTLAEIETLARDALIRAGADPAQADPLARSVAATEAIGVASHGLAYLPTYVQHLGCGKVIGTATPVVTRPKPGAVAVDAGRGFAHAAIDAGFAQLIPLARAQGIALLTVRESYNCGVLGLHVERLARAGLLALGFTNAPASIAPSGGAAPAVGTNPIAMAAPGADGPALVLDQSASAIAKSEVMTRAREGRPIPEGWALDADGRPTTDAAAGLKGSMAPSGGYKGVGLALIVETFAAALSGALLGTDAAPFSGTAGGPPRTGQAFVAIDPAAASGDVFAARMAALTDGIRAQPGARLPGDGRAAARARAEAEGVDVPQATLDRIEAALAG